MVRSSGETSARELVQREALLGTATEAVPAGIDAVVIVDAYRGMACAADVLPGSRAALEERRSLEARGLLGIVD
jgi:hypothetical protein